MHKYPHYCRHRGSRGCWSVAFTWRPFHWKLSRYLRSCQLSRCNCRKSLLANMHFINCRSHPDPWFCISDTHSPAKMGRLAAETSHSRHASPHKKPPERHPAPAAVGVAPTTQPPPHATEMPPSHSDPYSQSQSASFMSGEGSNSIQTLISGMPSSSAPTGPPPASFPAPPVDYPPPRLPVTTAPTGEYPPSYPPYPAPPGQPRYTTPPPGYPSQTSAYTPQPSYNPPYTTSSQPPADPAYPPSYPSHPPPLMPIDTSAPPPHLPPPTTQPQNYGNTGYPAMPRPPPPGHLQYQHPPPQSHNYPPPSHPPPNRPPPATDAYHSSYNSYDSQRPPAPRPHGYPPNNMANNHHNGTHSTAPYSSFPPLPAGYRQPTSGLLQTPPKPPTTAGVLPTVRITGRHNEWGHVFNMSEYGLWGLTNSLAPGKCGSNFGLNKMVDILQNIFCQLICSDSQQNSTEMFSNGRNWWQVSIGTGNGSGAVRQQIFTWTNADKDLHWDVQFSRTFSFR